MASFAVVFMFVFAPRIDVGLALHLGYLSVGVLILAGARAVPRLVLDQQFIQLAGFFVFLGLYHSLVGMLVGTESFTFLRVMLSLPLYIAFGFLFRRLFIPVHASQQEATLRMLRVYVYCIFANSALLLLEYFVPQLKETVESVLIREVNANIDYASHPFRLRGLSAAGGAALSVANALGLWLCLALVLRGVIGQVQGYTMAVVIAASNIFVGRTGLAISVVFLIIHLLTLMSSRVGIKRLVAYGTLFSIGMFILSQLHWDRAVTAWAFAPLIGLAADPSDSYELHVLRTMLFLPDEPVQLLFGVGYFIGRNVLQAPTDSGYVKTVLAVGLPLACLLYGSILVAAYRVIKSSSLAYVLLPIFLIGLVVEVKEPFMYQNIVGRLVFMLIGIHLAHGLFKRRLTSGQVLANQQRSGFRLST
jgi:hypothetical protein